MALHLAQWLNTHVHCFTLGGLQPMSPLISSPIKKKHDSSVLDSVDTRKRTNAPNGCTVAYY